VRRHYVAVYALRQVRLHLTYRRFCSLVTSRDEFCDALRVVVDLHEVKRPDPIWTRSPGRSRVSGQLTTNFNAAVIGVWPYFLHGPKYPHRSATSFILLWAAIFCHTSTDVFNLRSLAYML